MLKKISAVTSSNLSRKRSAEIVFRVMLLPLNPGFHHSPWPWPWPWPSPEGLHSGLVCCPLCPHSQATSYPPRHSLVWSPEHQAGNAPELISAVSPALAKLLVPHCALAQDQTLPCDLCPQHSLQIRCDLHVSCEEIPWRGEATCSKDTQGLPGELERASLGSLGVSMLYHLQA